MTHQVPIDADFHAALWIGALMIAAGAAIDPGSHRARRPGRAVLRVLPAGGADVAGEVAAAASTLVGLVRPHGRHDPQHVVAAPPSLKWLLILAGCAAFAAGGAFMIRDGEAAGWFVFAVFALFTLAAIGAVLPNSGYLRLTPDGFELRSLFRSSLTRWSDVSSFEWGSSV